MKIFNVVRKNTYYDSVALMLLSKQLKKIESVEAVSVMMGTPANRDILKEANLLGDEGTSAGPNDLIMAFRAPENSDVDAICQLIDEQMAMKTASVDKPNAPIIRSAEKAYIENPDINLAVISVPGEYAASETYRALKHGKNVFLFSDNVSIEEEAEVKSFAAKQGLLVMGPDCGTAIINGVGIGFANRIRKGNIGIVGASGTGIQEVACLIDAMGLGISQAIGTGGRDLKEVIGAITMLQALDFLQSDAATETIILISKPPSKSVVQTIIGKLSNSTKKIILCFIGYEGEVALTGITVASTLEDAALAAARMNGIQPSILHSNQELTNWAVEVKRTLSTKQKYVRALYTGGTLCYEAMLVMEPSLGPLYSNTPLHKECKFAGVMAAGHHICIDLGDDEYTKGKPHPMIDGTLRHEYIAQVATDPEMAVLLLDVVIGYGSSADPAGDLVPVLEAAKAKAKALGNELPIIAYVCGTDGDEQNKADQIAKLKAVGAYVTNSNAEAARLTSLIAAGKETI